jgi:osmotically-inducible protein OsmY
MKPSRHFSVSFSALLFTAFFGIAAARQPADHQITSWVEEVIRAEPFAHSSKVDVTTRNGIVTLSGTVGTLAGKEYSILETRKVRGVQGLIDEIIVLSPPRAPTDIRQDILRKLIHSADLSEASIHVEVSMEGKVVLSGEVDSWTRREEAELLASEVLGVNVIVNRLHLDYKKERSDSEIRDDVVANLERDVYLNDLPISVAVNNGVVTLTGMVGSLYEKERAYGRTVVVYNVRNVKNLLEVETEKNPLVRTRAPLPSDEELKKNIQAELAQDLRISNPYNISITVINGNVTLAGTVSSYYQKQLIAQDAHNVVGEGWVDNLLTVEAPWRADSWLRNDLQFEMDTDPYLNDEDIRIHVKQGVVTLTGQVNTFYQKLHAGEVASRVLGVREVVNVLTVRQPVKFSDAALTERVSKRLIANAITGPVADRISVKVDDGKVMLSGDLDSWAQYEEAARVALLTDGVRGLDNRLSVSGVKRFQEEWK